MQPKRALQLMLAQRGEPVVTEAGLFLLLRELSEKRSFQGEDVAFRTTEIDERQFAYFRRVLLADRYLRPDEDFTGYAYRVSDVPDGSAEEITAIVDPFCYLSHLSAMQRYGLTTRAPQALTLSTPRDWRGEANRLERLDSGLFPDAQFRVPLRHIPFPKEVRRRPVALHATARTPAIKPIRGSRARIAAIGEVFVQMLDRPELCGGMAHVLEVWGEHAVTYVQDIIPAIEAAPEKIVKVRAGYILDERLRLHDPRIETWSRFAQRGGSRRLDPSRRYVSTYSDKWMISLNVDAPESSA
jgi:predicted transcriptional regulator of viral defense system